MNSLISITPEQLRRAADIQERIQDLQAELSAVLATSSEPGGFGAPGGKRKLSAQGIANIRAGVRKRWAAARVGGVADSGPKPKRKMSAAGRAAISAAAKARWAQAKASGRNSL